MTTNTTAHLALNTLPCTEFPRTLDFPTFPALHAPHCWLGYLTHKNPSPIWPIMCLVGR